MSVKSYLSLIVLLVGCFTIRAQSHAYDPLLDPKVKITSTTTNHSAGEYLWYPGQLSAHLQQKRLRESRSRCVNVGYPGNFYAPVNKSSFRKTVVLKAETLLEWKATGSVKAFVNGTETTTNPVKLSKGKTVLLFEVRTENELPTIRISFNGQPSVGNWQASLDGKTWNRAETSPVFGRSGKMPMDDPETWVEIRPDSFALNLASVQGQTINIQPGGNALVDFHHLEMGNVTFSVKGKGKLVTVVGETPQEAFNVKPKGFEQVLLDTLTLSATDTEITLPERAVRYLKISSDEGCEITNLTFHAKVWPVQFLMSFECNDHRINDIWNASVATQHTSTHGFYLDGIKRDYLPWSMDAVLSTFGADYLFGDEQVARNSLSVALLPLNPQKSDLGIPDYPLHALIGFEHYYLRYGDFNTILAYRDRMEQLLHFYETLQDERGFISSTAGSSWGFIPGWATRRGPDKKGTPAYAQIMLYYNFKIGAAFAEKWGDKASANHFREKAEFLRKSILHCFWDEQQGLFVNGYKTTGELDKTVSHHAQYWAVLAGIFPENSMDNMFDFVQKIPYYRDYVSYEKGYEFLAYAKARKVREMWSFLQDVFGDWLEQGHTRFPENFSYKKSKEQQLVFYNRPIRT
ncbi:MAG: trehalase family glycosidase [Paludibacter sp.]